MDLIATRWSDQRTGACIEVTKVHPDESMTFAVRLRGQCLNNNGDWEHEPSPSNRDAGFLNRCRFADFGEAAKAVEGIEL